MAAATVLPLCVIAPRIALEGHFLNGYLYRFHGFGHHASLRCIGAAKPLFVYPPHLPTTASNIVDFLRVCRKHSPVAIKQMFAVAYILKLLSESQDACESLAQFDVVAFAGSALPDETGDKLTAEGVKLISQYG